jgi:hypothetical protein
VNSRFELKIPFSHESSRARKDPWVPSKIQVSLLHDKKNSFGDKLHNFQEEIQKKKLPPLSESFLSIREFTCEM